MGDFLARGTKRSARVYVDAQATAAAARPSTQRKSGAGVVRQLSHDISTEQLLSDQLIDGKVPDGEDDEDDDDAADNNGGRKALSKRDGGTSHAAAPPELYRIESHSALSSLEAHHVDKQPNPAVSSSETPAARQAARPHKLAPLAGSPTRVSKPKAAIPESDHTHQVQEQKVDDKQACDKCRSGADMPPLHSAAFAGHVDCLAFLVDHEPPGASATDKKQRTPLFYACAANRLDCCDLLLQRHREWLELPDKQLDTPVHVCCFFGWHECLQKLLNAGANPHTRNAKGFKPSHIAKNSECLELLLSYGDDLLQGDKLGRTPLFVGCARDRAPCVEFLCAWNHRSHSWMLEQEDQRGDRPIHAAACNGSAASLEILLKYGADPLSANAKGLTPKDLALASHHDKCVELLTRAEEEHQSNTSWFAPANAVSYDCGDHSSQGDGNGGEEKATEWVECWDNDSNQPFYYNNLTGKCQWEVPTGFTPQLYEQQYQRPQQQQQDAAISNAQSSGGGEQEEEKEDDGGEYVWVKKKRQTVTVVTGKDTEWMAVQDPVSRAIYYKNTRTGQSQWEEPDAVRQLQNAAGAKASQEASRLWEELEQARTALAAAIAKEKLRQLATHKQTLEACKLHVLQRKEDMKNREEQARLAQLLPRSSFIRRKKQSMIMKVSKHNTDVRGNRSSASIQDEQASCEERIEEICSREPALDIFLSTYLRLHGVRDLQVLTTEKRFFNCLFHYYVALADPMLMKGLSKSQFRLVLRDALVIPSSAAATATASSRSLTAAGLSTGPPLKLHVIDLIFAQAERAMAMESSTVTSAPSSPASHSSSHSSLLHHRQAVAASSAIAPGGEAHLTVSGFTTAMQIVRERVVAQVEQQQQQDGYSEIDDDEEWFLLTFLVPLALRLGSRLLAQIRQSKELDMQVSASQAAQEVLSSNRVMIQSLHRHYSVTYETKLKMLTFRGLGQFALDFGLLTPTNLSALQFLLEAVHWISGNAHTEIISFEKFQQVLTMLATLPLPPVGGNSSFVGLVGTAESSSGSSASKEDDRVVIDLAAFFQRLATSPSIHRVTSQSHLLTAVVTPSEVGERTKLTVIVG